MASLGPNELTHCGLAAPYGIANYAQLDQVMAGCLMEPSHYLNKCWLVGNWNFSNKLQWNMNKIQQENSFKKTHLKMLPTKFRPFCSGANVFSASIENILFFNFISWINSLCMFMTFNSYVSQGLIISTPNRPTIMDGILTRYVQNCCQYVFKSYIISED